MAFSKCRVESVENPSPPLRAHGNFQLPRKIDVTSLTRCMQPSLHERSMQAVDFLKITARQNIEWHMCCPLQVPDYKTTIGPSMPCRRTPPRIATKSGHEVYSYKSGLLFCQLGNHQDQLRSVVAQEQDHQDLQRFLF